MSEITVLCKLKPHLRNYIEAKMGSGIASGEPIEITTRNYLGKTVKTLLSKTPKIPLYPNKEESLVFKLPYFSDKNILSYNYLSVNSQKIIQRAVQDVFFLELYALVSKATRKKKYTQKEAINFFMETYELYDHITFDALKRSYYRFIEREANSNEGKELVEIFNTINTNIFA